MAHKTKNGKWRVHLRYGGRRVSRNFPTKAMAEMFEAKVRLAKHEPNRPRLKKATFAEFAAVFMANHSRPRKSPAAAAIDENILKVHLLPRFCEKALRSLRAFDLEEAQREMASGRSPKTVKNILGLARCMMTKAVEWEYLAENPWKAVKDLNVSEQPYDFWTQEEVKRFVEGARFPNAKLAEVVEVAANTGLRRGELRALLRCDCDLLTKQIRVRATWCDRTAQRLERTKSRRIRYVPMNDAVFRVLSRRASDSGLTPIFDQKIFRDLTGAFHRLQAKLEVKRIRFHDLRHTFATNLASTRRVSLYQIQALLGHSTPTQTQRYAHLLRDDLSAATDLLGTDLAPTAEKETVNVR